VDAIKQFETLLAAGKDGPLLRFGLANAYLAKGEHGAAIEHLQAALRLDATYSAAWKLLGKALAAAGRSDEAMHVYAQGIAVAQEKGDIQAAKEMTVFLRRLRKDAPAS
jgi:predicted Zn-dependent protease